MLRTKLLRCRRTTDARWHDLVRWQFVGVKGHRQDFLCPESGAWEVGLGRFFVRLADNN